jgi:hypothetical protein
MQTEDNPQGKRICCELEQKWRLTLQLITIMKRKFNTDFSQIPCLFYKNVTSVEVSYSLKSLLPYKIEGRLPHVLITIINNKIAQLQCWYETKSVKLG